MLEVELNNPFLKDGLRIIVPPDIDVDGPFPDLHTLKQTHSELYSKRDLILKNFNPVYLYAVDRIGKNIFSDNFAPNSMATSRSEEDFWSTFNLYHMSRSGEGEGEGEGERGDEVVERQPWKERGGPAVFNAEVNDWY